MADLKRELVYAEQIARAGAGEQLKHALDEYVARSELQSPRAALMSLVTGYHLRWGEQISLATLYSWLSGRRKNPDLSMGLRALVLLREDEIYWWEKRREGEAAATK